MRRIRSILARLVLVALLGIATTVVVAWLLAALLPHQHLRRRGNLVGEPSAFVSVIEFSRPGMVRRAWNGGFIRTSDLRYDDATIKLKNPTVNQDRSWGDLPGDLAHPKQTARGAEDARGWPYLCLWCTIDEAVIQGAPGRPIRGGILLSRMNSKTTSGSIRALPLCPIWRGLLADAAVYAGAWAVFIPAIRALRAAIRRRRGLCPRCGYNLRHEFQRGCPECGWNRRAEPAVTEPS